MGSPPVERKSWATVKFNDDFVDVTACAGYRACYLDPESWSIQLAPTESDEGYGRALVNALDASRFLEPQEAYTAQAEAPKKYELWANSLIERFGYKSRRAMFKKMKSCSVTRKQNIIYFKPLKHHKLEAWSGDGISEDDQIVIGADRPFHEIGAALRIALVRCT